MAPLLVVVAVAALFAQSPGPAARKQYPVSRLDPAAFPELPKNLLADLQRRGCSIPQPFTNRKANVIRGEFAKPGQTDWAVLCSARGTTSLLLFWNGSAENPLVLAKKTDDPERIFDWYIRPVGRKFIMDHHRVYGGPKPPPIDHQGIESANESASVVLYRHGGKWIKLQGAD